MIGFLLSAQKEGEEGEQDDNDDAFLFDEEPQLLPEDKDNGTGQGEGSEGDESDSVPDEDEDEDQPDPNMDEIASADQRRLAIANAQTKRKKHKARQASVDPSKHPAVACVFFRMGQDEEHEGFLYCLASQYAGQQCKGRVKLAEKKGGGYRIKVENLTSHVERMHSSWYEVCTNAAADGKSARDAFNTLAKNAKLLNNGKEQRYMESFFSKRDRKPGLVDKQLALFLWLVKENISFNSLNSPLWEQFLTLSQLELQSAKTIQRLIDPVFSVAREDGIMAIRKAGSYSISVDLWTSEAKDHYLAIVYHYVDDELNRRSVVLDLADCQASATGALIQELIQNRTDQHFGFGTGANKDKE